MAVMSAKQDICEKRLTPCRPQWAPRNKELSPDLWAVEQALNLGPQFLQRGTASFDLEDSVCVCKHLTHERAVYRSQAQAAVLRTSLWVGSHSGWVPQPRDFPWAPWAPLLFNKVSYLFQEDFSITILVDLFKEVGWHLAVPDEHVPLWQASHELQQLDVKHQHRTAGHFSVCHRTAVEVVLMTRQRARPSAPPPQHPGSSSLTDGGISCDSKNVQPQQVVFPNCRQWVSNQFKEWWPTFFKWRDRIKSEYLIHRKDRYYFMKLSFNYINIKLNPYVLLLFSH